MTLGGTLIFTVTLGFQGKYRWPHEMDHSQRRGGPHEQMV
jgi:hypothetical protein